LTEQCQNPLKPTCKNTDILLYIISDSEKIPVCQQCWNELANLDVNWNKEELKREEKHNPIKQI